ncbi:type IV secretion system lytic transglycosylase VirB1 [Rhizobium leguminosarum]|uniref:type IV secretion system lytic transglycosylase VirB1 n=1 Tax=Rhizobium leguminosarum TaxID=384 RepID=UPI001C921B86|nr:type IV secretion system lytic transglycosylase VirB1 [Rhizobium leguminosarum]MBY3003609.1 type IV secretion system lytic transglycosylase VirB1 [Rhizobium leguminosarum]MBY3026891.1 type IV secretion system lytic transglycosylase VirB1 [Rhizobium leguminosarum]
MFPAAWPLAMAVLTSTCLSSEAAPVSFHEFDRLARDCAPSVDPTTLAAIAKVESGFDPLAAHDNTTGESLHWDDQTQARRGVKDRLDAQHSIDVGLMQINSKNFPVLNLTIENALQPCKSLAAAAYLLKSRYAGGDNDAARQLALRKAISAYNTGDLQSGFANGYVQKVEAAAREIVPRLIELPQQAHEKQISADKWDVWGSYEQERSDDGSARLPDMKKSQNLKLKQQ